MMTNDFAIVLLLPAMRVRYHEPLRQRSVTIAISVDDENNWWLWPDTATWWKHNDVASEPVRDDKRPIILQRVIENMRGRHSLWMNIAGQTNDQRPRSWKAPPMRTDIDPELAMLDEFLNPESTKPASRIAFQGAERETLLSDIERALKDVQPMADAGWDAGQSIARQLQWCRSAILGEAVETPPGPFSMGLMATREFDMYGQKPELASLINEIERAMNRHGFP